MLKSSLEARGFSSVRTFDWTFVSWGLWRHRLLRASVQKFCERVGELRGSGSAGTNCTRLIPGGDSLAPRRSSRLQIKNQKSCKKHPENVPLSPFRNQTSDFLSVFRESVKTDNSSILKEYLSAAPWWHNIACFCLFCNLKIACSDFTMCFQTLGGFFGNSSNSLIIYCIFLISYQ